MSFILNSNHSIPGNVQVHTILLLLKMSIDLQVGEALAETVEASLSSLLQSLGNSRTTDLISLIVNNIPDLPLQCRILSTLPIQPSSAAKFRQNLAKAFLNIPPTAPPSSLLTCLQSNFPFTEIKRDISNEHARAVQYSIQIFDIAMSKPESNQREVIEKIKRQLQDMHRRIVDNCAQFMVRTDAKQVIHQVCLRLEEVLRGTQSRNGIESLDKFLM